MQELAILLDRLSIAVHFAVVMCLVGYFLLLGFMVRLREVRLWMLAWLCNAGALAAVFFHVYAEMPVAGHRAALVVYLAGKTGFAALVFAGARRHLVPGASPLASTMALAVMVALWGVVIGIGAPAMWQAQLAQSALVAVIFLVGAFMLLRNPRSRASRWLGWTMGLEGSVFTYVTMLLLPAVWGQRNGFASLASSSLIETTAELILALASIAVVAEQRERQLNYANRELIEAQQRLSRIEDLDPMTSLATRRALRRGMDRMVASGGVIIFIDINRLDEVNQLFGRPAGDLAIRRLAELLRSHFRPDDEIIRWGGDEFLVLAPGLDEAGAASRVAGVRTGLRTRDGELPPVSIAVGIAALPCGGSPTQSIEDADRRMWADKRRGRPR